MAGDLRNLSDLLRQRLTSFSKAFNAAAKKGTMTEFRLLENEPDTDGFMRIASDGHGIAACFNRSGSEKRFEIPAGYSFTNVENGSKIPEVPAQNCAMFTVQPKP